MTPREVTRGDTTLDGVPDPPIGTRQLATLVVLAGPNVGQIYPLSAGKEIVIGRDKAATVSLLDDGVSRHHARVVAVDKRSPVLQDLGSRNGTFINGGAVQEHILADGDRIQIGLRTIIKFVLVDDIEDTFQRRLIEAAMRDPVTGLYNRHHFDERLIAEFSGARRHRRDLSLLLVDVDHFKTVNDQHGHLAGDETLKTLAHVMDAAIRREDLLARFGGEEFVLLARETDLSRAEHLANRMRQTVESTVCNFGERPIQVTVSIGVTTCAGAAQLDPALGMHDLLETADRALYLAKKKGRNQVVALPFPFLATSESSG